MCRVIVSHVAGRIVLFCAGLVLLGSSVPGASPDESSAVVEKMVRKIDKLYKSTSSKALVEMEIVTPHWERTLRMREWTRGMEKVLVKILEPKKERGVGTLKLGTEMWNYLPNTGKVIKIPPSMMMSSWMGSDLTNDDLVKEYTFYEDYTFSLIHPEDGADSLHYIQCVPKPGRPIVWGKVVVAVQKENYLPVSLNYYDEDATLVRVWKFDKVQTFGSRTIPSRITVIPKTEKGHKTVLRYIDIEFNADIQQGFFSLRRLRAPVRTR